MTTYAITINGWPDWGPPKERQQGRLRPDAVFGGEEGRDPFIAIRHL